MPLIVVQTKGKMCHFIQYKIITFMVELAICTKNNGANLSPEFDLKPASERV